MLLNNRRRVVKWVLFGVLGLAGAYAVLFGVVQGTVQGILHAYTEGRVARIHRPCTAIPLSSAGIMKATISSWLSISEPGRSVGARSVMNPRPGPRRLS